MKKNQPDLDVPHVPSMLQEFFKTSWAICSEMKTEYSWVNITTPEKTHYLTTSARQRHFCALRFTDMMTSGDLLTSAEDVLRATLGLTHADPLSLSCGEVVGQADIKHLRGERTAPYIADIERRRRERERKTKQDGQERLCF